MKQLIDELSVMKHAQLIYQLGVLLESDAQLRTLVPRKHAHS